MTNPRKKNEEFIRSGNLLSLLDFAASLHGHYCGGLALGVLGSFKAMTLLDEQNDGMEDMIAITEINNCMTDGIQAITGCTFGNNSLHFYDLGKMAFTLASRKTSKAFRFVIKDDAKEKINAANVTISETDMMKLQSIARTSDDVAVFKQSGYVKAHIIVNMNPEEIFHISPVPYIAKPYAPSSESIVCSLCDETFMKSKAVISENSTICRMCSSAPIPVFDGKGISDFHK
jgi:formylmethanofuran dehydrogenase subunit E